MKRSVKLKSDAASTLVWLHDWLYRKVVEDGQGIFESQDLSTPIYFEAEEKSKLTHEQYATLRSMTDQDYVYRMNKLLQKLTVTKGKLSDLFISETLLSLIAFAQYSIEFSAQDVISQTNKFPVLSIKCYNIGEYRTEVIAYCSPDVDYLVGKLWLAILSTFEVEDKPFLSTAEDGNELVMPPLESAKKLAREILQIDKVAKSPALQNALSLYLFNPEKTLADIASNTGYKNQESLSTTISAVRKELIKVYGPQRQQELLPNQ